MKWIQDGSYFDLGAILYFGGSNYKAVPRSLLVPLFEAILANLEKFQWYNARGPRLFRRARHDHVWMLLHAITVFDEDFIRHSDEMAELILKSWSKIIKWLRILTEETSEDAVQFFFANMGRCGCIASLIQNLAASEKTKHIPREEEVIAFVFDYWSRSDHEFKTLSYASSILTNSIIDVEKNLRMLVKISKWDLHQIMDLMLSRIHLAASYASENPFLVKCFVDLLQVTTSQGYEPATALVLGRDANGALLHVVKCSLDCKEVPDCEISQHVSLVNNCLGTIETNFQQFTDSECIRAFERALRNGMLEIYLTLSTHCPLDNDDEQSYPNILLRTHLPRFLIFPSCVHETVKAIQKLSASALSAVSEGCAAYRKAWCDLQRLLSYRLASTAYFSSNKPLHRCSSVRIRLKRKCSISLTSKLSDTM